MDSNIDVQNTQSVEANSKTEEHTSPVSPTTDRKQPNDVPGFNADAERDSVSRILDPEIPWYEKDHKFILAKLFSAIVRAVLYIISPEYRYAAKLQMEYTQRMILQAEMNKEHGKQGARQPQKEKTKEQEKTQEQSVNPEQAKPEQEQNKDEQEQNKEYEAQMLPQPSEKQVKDYEKNKTAFIKCAIGAVSKMNKTNQLGLNHKQIDEISQKLTDMMEHHPGLYGHDIHLGEINGIDITVSGHLTDLDKRQMVFDEIMVSGANKDGKHIEDKSKVNVPINAYVTEKLQTFMTNSDPAKTMEIKEYAPSLAFSPDENYIYQEAYKMQAIIDKNSNIITDNKSSALDIIRANAELAELKAKLTVEHKIIESYYDKTGKYPKNPVLMDTVEKANNILVDNGLAALTHLNNFIQIDHSAAIENFDFIALCKKSLERSIDESNPNIREISQSLNEHMNQLYDEKNGIVRESVQEELAQEPQPVEEQNIENVKEQNGPEPTEQDILDAEAAAIAAEQQAAEEQQAAIEAQTTLENAEQNIQTPNEQEVSNNESEQTQHILTEDEMIAAAIAAEQQAAEEQQAAIEAQDVPEHDIPSDEIPREDKDASESKDKQVSVEEQKNSEQHVERMAVVEETGEKPFVKAEEINGSETEVSAELSGEKEFKPETPSLLHDNPPKGSDLSNKLNLTEMDLGIIDLNAPTDVLTGLSNEPYNSSFMDYNNSPDLEDQLVGIGTSSERVDSEDIITTMSIDLNDNTKEITTEHAHKEEHTLDDDGLEL